MSIVWGEALIGLVPVAHGDEQAYAARAGGSSFNVAMSLGRLGAPPPWPPRTRRQGAG
jgi:fructokinase